MVRETVVQSQVESYQKLKKWYLMPPCKALSTIRWWSRVKWSNPGKGGTPSPTPQCSSYWKGSFLVTRDYGCQLYYIYIYIYMYIHIYIYIYIYKWRNLKQQTLIPQLNCQIFLIIQTFASAFVFCIFKHPSST